MAFIKFTQQEFERCLSSIGLGWRPYRYRYADSTKAGELAYRIDISQWVQIIVYSTVAPASKVNKERGTAGVSRNEGRDAIRFVIEYKNLEHEIKPVGGYPRIYRRRAKKEDLFQDVSWVILKLYALAVEGLTRRCACGRARPPRYKVHDDKKKVTYEGHWFLGGCLVFGECNYTTTMEKNHGETEKRADPSPEYEAGAP